MCAHKDYFLTYDPIDSIVIRISNNAQLGIVARIGIIKIEVHDGAITLSNVCTFLI